MVEEQELQELVQLLLALEVVAATATATAIAAAATAGVGGDASAMLASCAVSLFRCAVVSRHAKCAV